MRHATTFVVVLATLVSAATCEERPVPPRPPAGDGGTIADCDRMCAVLERLGCESKWSIEPEDGACEVFCRDAETLGPSVCPALVATARSCEEADALSQECDQ